MKSKNCYNQVVKKDTLLVATEDAGEFNLTPGRVYLCLQADTNLWVINDQGQKVGYAYEWFDFYNGQTLNDY